MLDKIFFLFFIVFGTFLFPNVLDLSKEEKSFIEEHPVINLASGVGFDPFVIKNDDGTFSGHDVELLDIISKKTGLKFNFTVGDWTQMQKMTKERKFDGLFSAGYVKSREEYADASLPYIKLTTLVITRKGNPKNINSIEDLEGKTAVVQRGNHLFKNIVKNSCKDITIIEVDTIPETIRAVVDKKADFTVLDESIFYLANSIGLNSMIETTFSIGEPFNMVFWFRDDWPQLTSIVNKALDTIDVKAKLQIRNRWFSNMNRRDIRLSLEEELFLDNNPTLIFGVPSAPPFIFKENGEFKGYIYDLINLLGKKNNFQAKFVMGDYNYLIDNLKNKKIDVIPAINETQERRDNMLFTKYETIKRTYSIYTINDVEFNKPKDFFGKKVGVVKEWKSTKYFMKKYPLINFIQYDTPKELMKAIAHSRIDGAINIVTIAEYINKNMMFNNLKQSCILEFDSPLKMAIRKDTPQLQSIIDKTLNSYSTSNEIELLKQKWFRLQKEGRYNLLSKVQKRYLKSKKQIRVCVDPGWVPYDFIREGKHLGVGSDLLKSMVKDLPIELSFLESNSWDKSLEKIKNKKCDIIPLAMKTDSRDQYLNFTSSYLTIPVVLASNGDVDFIDNIESLIDKKIAIVKGFAIAEVFKEKYPNLKIIEVDSINPNYAIAKSKTNQTYHRI
ncbi:MAG: transporter substrate-binding domain-containing protein [Campylobacterota bacterium]|nr:transporter substrate-binding domain-containing protein [Campylobacterota bacterium]